MKKILEILTAFILIIAMTACSSKEKNVWKDTYSLTYFTVEGCSNCKYFQESVLPAIKEEFGKHLTITHWNMDDDTTKDEMKTAYDNYINNIIDFNQNDYGYGPFVVLDGYFAQLGAGDSDDYVENLVNAIKGKELNDPANIETRYYLKDGKVQNK